jgi:peptidoglycan/xylan/chitin deacetylase (PgdA/CDA1 family)
MRPRGLARTLRRARISRTRGRDRPIILVYHRVARVSTDPQLLSVSPERFAEHLELIADRYETVRLAELVASAHEGQAPPHAVAVTFDDGYADNLDVARPLLERSSTPATVFVASGYVGGQGAFWWDELEWLLLRPGRLPSTVILEIGAERLRCELGEDAVYTSGRAAACAGWTVLDDQDAGSRQRLYRLLCARLRVLNKTERARVLEHLRLITEAEGSDGEMPRPLTVEEIVRLADGGLVDIGAHTVTHPVLSQLSPQLQQEEITGSKRTLEEALGRRLVSFAYPYGAPGDFDTTTASIVRDAGFHHACATVPGRLNGRTDLFRIPRLVVRNWTADELARRLSEIEA